MLHGTIDVTIVEFTLNCMIKKKVRVIGLLSYERVFMTKLVEMDDRNILNWNEKFIVYCAHECNDRITFKLCDDRGKELCEASHPIDPKVHVDERLTWQIDTRGSYKGKIALKLKFLAATEDPNWNEGISAGYSGVPGTIFPQLEGCRVTLYQDAHVSDEFVRKITDTSSFGDFYEPKCCWKDIYDAINRAQELVYIAGWSIDVKTILVDDQTRPKETLGDLLKRKAESGVKVLMLIWKDKSRTMKTHCYNTQKFFDDQRGEDKVHCVSCSSTGEFWEYSSVYGFFISVRKSLGDTHHQKIVIVDSDSPDGASSSDDNPSCRRLMSFIGGLDLCGGRHDTESHPTFRKPTPWHDIHCRLEGPAAGDVLSNFEQRWSTQGIEVKGVKPENMCEEYSVLKENTKNHIAFGGKSNWNVQVFRSITSAVANFNSTQELSQRDQLKNLRIDHSIHDAYVNAIRRAKRFIYIENQYLIGSSMYWKTSHYDGLFGDESLVEVYNLIPKELSLKIASKIEKDEEFSVYIVLPMWPDNGDPNSTIVQDLLIWHRETIKMMYSDVKTALDSRNKRYEDRLEDKPEDYLSFFCLGKCEENGRSMIYVHSKMMIVDDEYIIVGSANLNDRSMAGDRDTEIAMGAYQPDHLCQDNNPARGQIYGFRMSLWYEHLGEDIAVEGQENNVFRDPEMKECMKEINRLAIKNSDSYLRKDVKNYCGHLLKYPMEFDKDGNMVARPGWEHYPDTKGSVLGREKHILHSYEECA